MRNRRIYRAIIVVWTIAFTVDLGIAYWLSVDVRGWWQLMLLYEVLLGVVALAITAGISRLFLLTFKPWIIHVLIGLGIVNALLTLAWYHFHYPFNAAYTVVDVLSRIVFYTSYGVVPLYAVALSVKKVWDKSSNAVNNAVAHHDFVDYFSRKWEANSHTLQSRLALAGKSLPPEVVQLVDTLSSYTGKYTNPLHALTSQKATTVDELLAAHAMIDALWLGVDDLVDGALNHV